jgi:hypothetical protein
MVVGLQTACTYSVWACFKHLHSPDTSSPRQLSCPPRLTGLQYALSMMSMLRLLSDTGEVSLLAL